MFSAMRQTPGGPRRETPEASAVYADTGKDVTVRILICEDNPLIALDLQFIVENDGHRVVGVCGTVEAARSHLDDDLDFALLDVDLLDGKSFGVAELLEARGVPFALVTASPLSDLPEALRTARFVNKPYREDAILETLARG